MISKSNVKFTGDVAWMVKSLLQHNAFVFIFFKTMYNKTILDSVFRDIQKNQGLLGGASQIKKTQVFVGYQDPVFWAWLETVLTPKRYHSKTAHYILSFFSALYPNRYRKSSRCGSVAEHP